MSYMQFRGEIVQFSIVAVAIFFLACSPKEEASVFSEFMEIESVKGESLNSSESINKATSLYYFNDYLFVYDSDNNSSFKIIDVRNDRFLKSFGKKGEGPCEYSFPVGLNWINSNKDKISVNDRRNFRIENYSLNEIITGSDSIICFNTKKDLNSDFQSVLELDSGIYFGYGLFKGRYAIQKSSNGEIVEASIGFPKRNEENTETSYLAEGMAFQGKLIKHPSLNKVVSTSLNSFSFDIVEIETDLNIELVNRIHHWYPDFYSGTEGAISVKMKEGNKFGCLDVSVSNDYIYILYSGKSNLFDDARQSNVILVYDWNGNPLKILETDKQISKIAVNLDDSEIIGFLDNEEPILISYKL